MRAEFTEPVNQVWCFRQQGRARCRGRLVSLLFPYRTLGGFGLDWNKDLTRQRTMALEPQILVTLVGAAFGDKVCEKKYSALMDE